MYDYTEVRPDWVMCGLPSGDGRVMILASTELSQAELEAQRDHFELIDPYDAFGPIYPGPTRYTLRIDMNRFVIVVADTYEQAFRSLFEQWSPKRASTPVGGHRQEITGG